MVDIKEGVLVKWSDTAIQKLTPREQLVQKNRIFVVVEIISDDWALIADELGEGQVCLEDLELVQ